MTVTHDGLEVSWLGYATTRIEAPDGTVVYTDPGRYGTLDGTWAEQYGDASHPSGEAYDARDGDLVVVTHDHHYDDDGVERVASEDATVVVYEGVSAENVADGGRDVVEPESLPYDVRRIGYGDDLTVAGVDVRAVPAYNHADGPNVRDGEPLHPEGLGCGFVLTVDGVPCFWTGDSDVLEGTPTSTSRCLCPRSHRTTRWTATVPPTSPRTSSQTSWSRSTTTRSRNSRPTRRRSPATWRVAGFRSSWTSGSGESHRYRSNTRSVHRSYKSTKSLYES